MQRNTGYFPTESLEPCGNRLFSRSALNEGYLFRGSLASALIAKKENQPIPPNVVDDIDEIISELEGINSKNNYLDFLSGIRVAVNFQTHKGKEKKAQYYILILNYNTKRLSIKSFMPSQFEEANEVYSSIESTK